MGFVFWIIVARSVSPSDFGLFSVVINLVSILFILCDVGFSSSIIRFLPQAIRDNKKEEVRRIVKLLKNPRLASKLGKQAVEDIKALGLQKNIRKQMLALYQ